MICKFKKSVLALAALGFASTSFAGVFTGIFGGIEGTYLQARNDDLRFVTVYPGLITGDITKIDNIYLPGDNNDWSYRLFGGMNFCGGEDVTFSFFIFNTSDSRAIPDPVGTNTLPGISQPRWLPSNPFSNIHGKIVNRLSDYYLEFGHTWSIAEPWTLRVAGGAEYTHLDSNMTVQGTLPTPTIPATGYESRSGLRAVGPRIAIGSNYNVPYGLSVFARGNAALLVGHRNITLDTLYTTPTNAFPSFYYKQRIPVVPKFGIRAGIGYQQTFGVVGGEGGASPTGTTFRVEAGWQAEAFIHAIERPAGNTSSRQALSPIVNNTDTVMSNYTYEGPFVTLSMNTYWL